MNIRYNTNPVICNIPHSATYIPDWAAGDFTIPAEQLREIAEFMADKEVDRLFDFVDEETKVVSAISRVAVDMERYRNDEEEPMAKLGMGLFYTRDHNGTTIRKKGETYESCIRIYDEYHRSFEEKTAACLEKAGRCIILDCHSFHDGMKYTGFPAEQYPYVCIGFNEKEPSAAALCIKKLFEKEGYSVKLNLPSEISITLRTAPQPPYHRRQL